VTGEGISGILNGGKLTELQLTYLDPNLEDGNYSTGIKLFVYAMGLELVDNYHAIGGGEWYPFQLHPAQLVAARISRDRRPGHRSHHERSSVPLDRIDLPRRKGKVWRRPYRRRWFSGKVLIDLILYNCPINACVGQ